ncbi:MAG: hypothetical protein R3C12_10635 [Planctomycetaceae bacterium]
METLDVNQKKAPYINKVFVSLGAYEFSNEQVGSVTISNANADGYVIADAIWLVPVQANGR